MKTDRAKNDLAKSLFPIAYKQAYVISEQSGVPMVDLESEAMYAVAMAIRSGVPEQPGFYRFVKLYVRGYLFNYLRDKARVVRIPRGLSLAYLSEQRQLKINPAYRAMNDKDKAELCGCTVAELRESRTAISLGHSELDFHDGCRDEAAAEDTSMADLVERVIGLGVSQVATQTRQPKDLVQTAFYKALRQVLELRHEQS